MALCFVANKELTVPLSDIARQLREAGEQIVWLSPSRRWSDWLLAEGWPQQDLVSMPDFAQEWQPLSVEAAVERLQGVEGEAPQTVSNLILMCRHLRRQRRSFSYPYLAVVRAHAEALLRNRNVEMVFGEGTWGFELMIWLICQRLDIPMVTPATTRVPFDRFYFADAVSADLCRFASPGADDWSWARTFLTEWRETPRQPTYMAQYSNGYTPLQRRWLREFAIAVFRPRLDRDDATLWPIQSRIADRLTRIVNAQSLKWFSPFERRLPDEPYVLYTLHHQPEAAVDVFGSLNSNQAAVIESLSRLLPASHKLWVKEHKGAIGDRSASWLRKIGKLPNVRLVDPFEDVFPLIRKADLVVTVSGTAAYEAALLGVPAVGLAPVYFSGLLDNRPTARSHPLEWPMGELLNQKPDREQRTQNAIEFLAGLHANSCAGDPIDIEAPDERRAQKGYLAREAEGFARFVAGVRARRHVAASEITA